MHASTIFALLAFSLVDAKAVRMRAEGAAAPMLAAAAPMPQASAAAAPPAAAAAAAATTADPTCAQAMILAQGIALNIQDQQQELATANQLMSILSTQPVNAQAYATSRTALLQFVNNGIAIRQSNQLITPAGNKAQAGVATVANAQLTELQLSTSLTAAGTDDVAGNMKIVQTLQGDFSGGIMQNMKNMADVSLLLKLPRARPSHIVSLTHTHTHIHALTLDATWSLDADESRIGYGRLHYRRRRRDRCWWCRSGSARGSGSACGHGRRRRSDQDRREAGTVRVPRLIDWRGKETA